MFIRMRESKGFTLVELMIVVAIIGILAAVAVPYYQKYIQKSRLTSRVFPGMHAIQTNVATFYSLGQHMPAATTMPSLYGDANTKCFTPSYAANVLTYTITAAAVCPELAALAGGIITATPTTASSATGGSTITGWTLGGTLAITLGLSGVQ